MLQIQDRGQYLRDWVKQISPESVENFMENQPEDVSVCKQHEELLLLTMLQINSKQLALCCRLAMQCSR